MAVTRVGFYRTVGSEDKLQAPPASGSATRRDTAGWVRSTRVPAPIDPLTILHATPRQRDRTRRHPRERRLCPQAVAGLGRRLPRRREEEGRRGYASAGARRATRESDCQAGADQGPPPRRPFPCTVARPRFHGACCRICQSRETLEGLRYAPLVRVVPFMNHTHRVPSV